jgi:hypothetical protein
MEVLLLRHHLLQDGEEGRDGASAHRQLCDLAPPEPGRRVHHHEGVIVQQGVAPEVVLPQEQHRRAPAFVHWSLLRRSTSVLGLWSRRR